jgi:adenylosuccinate synthase|eukprot:TRINITY_DN690_c0_g5_i1.p1 TRINITY_DN690_c0_g5~~TRINITY_DN690_c0_g5_i1.p1  ORF type:complete len:427 (+),score=218.08 TRINITY_DN690_c0_g5_i1:549-1829(+)
MSGGGQATVVIGSQWGDEGKGKLVDILAQTADVVARCQGGSNAGHTIVANGVKHAFHLLPSGILNPNAVCVMGNGVVVHFPTLVRELESLEASGIDYRDRLVISDRAHVLFDYHQTVDGLREVERGGSAIGTTKRGIGPCYSSKANRSGVRVGELLDFDTFPDTYRRNLANKRKRHGDFEHDEAAQIEMYRGFAERFRPMIRDTIPYLNGALRDGRTVLVEGANATMLDLDFGTYPFVTSSNCSVGGVCTGLGIPARAIGSVVGVVKAYTTRVGGGPFPTELTDDIGTLLQENGHEYGTTTGRRRRCGWLDVPVVRHAVMINGLTWINLTKLDVLSGIKELKIGTEYVLRGKPLEGFPALLSDLEAVEVTYETMPGWEEPIDECRSWDALPENARKYVERIEQLIGVKARWIGVGPARDAMIDRGE